MFELPAPEKPKNYEERIQRIAARRPKHAAHMRNVRARQDTATMLLPGIAC